MPKQRVSAGLIFRVFYCPSKGPVNLPEKMPKRLVLGLLLYFHPSPIFCKHRWTGCPLCPFWHSSLDQILNPLRRSTGFVLSGSGWPSWTEQADPFCCTPAWQLSFHKAVCPAQQIFCNATANACIGELLKKLPDLPPISELTFLVIASYQNNKTLVIARAIEYIVPSSITIISKGQKFLIAVYNRPTTEATNVIQLLESNGYECSLGTSTT